MNIAKLFCKKLAIQVIILYHSGKKGEDVMKPYIGIIIISLLLISGFSCRETPTAGNGTGTVYHLLTAEDVGVTDVFLRIRNFPGFQPSSIILKRSSALQPGDTTILKTILTSPETLIVDEGLLPKHTYNYTLTFPGGFGLQKKSAITVTTMDTTNSSFNWEIDTLGDGNSSVLYDVAIVSDTCVAVVGEIYIKDSLNNFDNEPYGAAIWNGVQWKLMKVPYRHFGDPQLRPGPLRAIYAFGVDDIYCASSAVLLHWDGVDWEEKAFFMTGIPFNGQVNKIYGTSGANLFCVGRNGAIYHVSDASWQKLESLTELNIYDIFGDVNLKTGLLEIYAVAGKHTQSFDKKILRIDGLNVTSLSDSNIPSTLHGIWLEPGRRYYVVGSGMYEKRDINDNSPWRRLDEGLTRYFTYAIRGNDINDIFVCGSFGEFIHFNGFSWKSYRNTGLIPDAEYYEISVKDNLVAMAGYYYDWAIIAIGRRK